VSRRPAELSWTNAESCVIEMSAMARIVGAPLLT
jgi:hypothetical protein